MEILKFPNETLFKVCDEVKVFGEELPIILEAMFETMKKAKGIGLSANQIGLLHRMFVMEGPKEEKIFLVNPVILRQSQVLAKIKEGCLSSPGEFLVISERASWVEVKFQDQTGKERIRVFKDIYAVCVQHELEHLNGKTFLQNKSLSKTNRKVLAKKWNLKN